MLCNIFCRKNGAKKEYCQII
ncbi:MAG: hypothetical protein DWQ06_10995 [Calditrichaeota bacterium]|nr:MAG: hypothetical protein DWQ06_10995 [Calditrichota bacterium]